VTLYCLYIIYIYIYTHTHIYYYAGLATLGEGPNITPSIEKAVRQCLRQLELLQSVWKYVLPATVYCKALGEIQFHENNVCMMCDSSGNSITGAGFVLLKFSVQSNPTVMTCHIRVMSKHKPG